MTEEQAKHIAVTWAIRDAVAPFTNADRREWYETIRSLRQSHDVTLNAPYRAETNITQIKKRAGK